MRILSEEGKHSALCGSYDNIMKQGDNSIRTRTQCKGLPPMINASKSLYHNSFLPQTIPDLKE